MATEVKTMDVKKQGREEQNTQATSLRRPRVREWIEEIKHEVKSIHWTSQEELRVYTQIVVGATFFFGMGVYIVDLMIHGTMNALTWVSRIFIG